MAERAREGAGRVTEGQRYDICVQKCLQGFARVVYDSVEESAKLEASELCFDWASVSRIWKNQSEIVGKTEEGSAFVLREKKMVPQCFLRMASELRTYKPSTER